MTESWGLAVGVAIIAGAWLGPVAAIAMVVIVGILQLVGARRNLAFILVVAGFALLGSWRMDRTGHSGVPPEIGVSTGAVVLVDSLPRTSPGGTSVIATVRELSFEARMSAVNPFQVWVWLPEGERAGPGDVLEVGWSARTVESLGPGYAGYLCAHGAVAMAYARWMDVKESGSPFYRFVIDLRYEITSGLQAALPGDAGALAAGIVTGDDSALSDAAKATFLGTGTTHITAVSGSNVAMVLAIWNLVVPAGRNRRLLAIQLLILVSIWVYALLVGLEPPALRAAIMASLIMFGSRFGRRPDLLTLLALSSAGMVLWNPEYVKLTSFWLSVVASAAIILRVPSAPSASWRGTARGMAEGVVMAQIATLPIVLFTFGTWSITSVIANVLVAPLTWIAFPLCFALAGIVLVAPILAPLMAVLPMLPLELTLDTVRVLSAAMTPLAMHDVGFAGVLAVGIPCLIGTAFLARDAQRWATIVMNRWTERPLLVASVLLGPGLGLLLSALIVVFRA